MAQSDDAPTPNPDAALLTAIEDAKRAWREVRRRDDSDPGLDVAAAKAIKLERQIARMPAMTIEGYNAKILSIREAEFDEDDLLAIMFRLGRDAERLGLEDEPPDLRAIGNYVRVLPYLPNWKRGTGPMTQPSMKRHGSRLRG